MGKDFSTTNQMSRDINSNKLMYYSINRHILLINPVTAFISLSENQFI